MRLAKQAKSLAIAVLFTISLWPAYTYAWPGNVQRIVDGDTISICNADGTEHRIRLYGVDCPETGQPEGERALQAALRLTEGYSLEVQELRRDRNGRVIAVVTLPDGMTVQELLLLYGLAWIDEQYCKRPECEAWRLLESSARISERGIWKSPNPIPPWEWRRGRR